MSATIVPQAIIRTGLRNRMPVGGHAAAAVAIVGQCEVRGHADTDRGSAPTVVQWRTGGSTVLTCGLTWDRGCAATSIIITIARQHVRVTTVFIKYITQYTGSFQLSSSKKSTIDTKTNTLIDILSVSSHIEKISISIL